MSPRQILDFSAVEDMSPLDAGRYRAQIEKMTFRPAPTDDKSDQISVQYIVTEDGDYLGRKAWTNLYLSAKALFRVKAWFNSMGLDGDEIAYDYDEETLEILEPDLVGVDVEITVKNELYQGEKQAKVVAVERVAPPKRLKKAKPAPEPEPEEDDEEEEEEEEAPPPKRTARRAVR